MNALDPKSNLDRLLFYGVLLLLGYAALSIVKPFLTPLAWAGIFTLCARPLFLKLRHRMGDTAGALLCTLLVTGILIIPVTLLALQLLTDLAQAATSLQANVTSLHLHGRAADAWEKLSTSIALPPLDDLKARALERAGKLTGAIASQAGTIVFATSNFLFKLFITLLALFFLLRDSDSVANFIRRLIPFPPAQREAMLEEARTLILTGTLTSLVVATCQGLAGGIILWGMGLHAPLFWGVVMAFCALVPVVGTSLVWMPAALWFLAAGDWTRGVTLIVLGILVIGGIDNILRPLLISGKTSMNGLVLFISMLGGIAAFGLIGLVLGPVVAATLISLLKTDNRGVVQK